MGILKELSIGGLVGLLIGIGLVTWVGPSAAGVALILLVCVAVGTLVGGIVSAMKRGTSTSNATGKSEPTASGNSEAPAGSEPKGTQRRTKKRVT